MLFAYPGCAEQCCSEGRGMQWRNTAVGDKGAVFHFGGLELGEVAERMHCLVFFAWKATIQKLSVRSGAMQPNGLWFFLNWVTSEPILRFWSQTDLWFSSNTCHCVTPPVDFA